LASPESSESSRYCGLSWHSTWDWPEFQTSRPLNGASCASGVELKKRVSITLLSFATQRRRPRLFFEDEDDENDFIGVSAAELMSAHLSGRDRRTGGFE